MGLGLCASHGSPAVRGLHGPEPTSCKLLLSPLPFVPRLRHVEESPKATTRYGLSATARSPTSSPPGGRPLFSYRIHSTNKSKFPLEDAYRASSTTCPSSSPSSRRSCSPTPRASSGGTFSSTRIHPVRINSGYVRLHPDICSLLWTIFRAVCRATLVSTNTCRDTRGASTLVVIRGPSCPPSY